jgi:hypothetical protein
LLVLCGFETWEDRRLRAFERRLWRRVFESETGSDGGYWKVFVFSVLMQKEDDLGEKVSILVGDSIGHYEKRSYENVSDSEHLLR